MLVNQKITLLKKEKGLTTADLARMTGIGHSVISRYEHGVIKYISPEQLQKFADALEIPYDKLIEGDTRYLPDSLEKTSQGRTQLYEKTEIQSDDDREVLYCYHMMPDNIKPVFRVVCQLFATNKI